MQEAVQRGGLPLSDRGAWRGELVALLRGGQAHGGIDGALDGVPYELQGMRPQGYPRSAWEILEHMRLCQRDILDYLNDPDYRAPSYPEGYWPEGADPPSPDAWEAAASQLRQDLASLTAMVSDPSVDLLQPVPSNSDHTKLREVLIVADHNAYHVGQLISLRFLLGIDESAVS